MVPSVVVLVPRQSPPTSLDAWQDEWFVYGQAGRSPDDDCAYHDDGKGAFAPGVETLSAGLAVMMAPRTQTPQAARRLHLSVVRRLRPSQP